MTVVGYELVIAESYGRVAGRAVIVFLAGHEWPWLAELGNSPTF
jgi:hypothetical protein